MSFTTTLLLAIGGQAFAQFGTYGDVTVVSPGPGGDPAFQITSNPSGIGYGGVFFTPEGTLLLDEITQLSADYEMTVGTFGGGSPRFSIADGSGNEAWLYWGTSGGGTFTDPNPGVWANTGNYANLLSSDLRVYSNNFGGDNNPNTGVPWALFVALAGNTSVSFISLDNDGGWSQAGGTQVDVNNFNVNGNVDRAPAAAPEPSTTSFMFLAAGLMGIAVIRRNLTLGRKVLRRG